MKLLTLNTHSWMEKQPFKKLEQLADSLAKQNFDVIALQEVNQLMRSQKVEKQDLATYVSDKERPAIKDDNFAYLLQKLLRKKGLVYYWTWIPMHIGYDRYDEGLAFLSKTPIEAVKSFYATEATDFLDRVTRRVLGIQTGGTWYFNFHLGWWDVKREPFKEQWQRCERKLAELDGRRVLMGDFNSPAHVSNEGYDLISNQWKDTFLLAEKKDSGITVDKRIDGWKNSGASLRIDHIFVDEAIPVHSSYVMYNDKNEPIVSDHFGVAVELEMK
ncbi:endonuclease/exonuclease/phosphatase family protein [Lacticigenium naphthae]|uniref:endonuclease/exonuclease/phosphatase family protein n=1 Tax=Lacticigenium naphthae TaxID=515351 RepID=UPI0004016E1A|nr:endonuclease/exonuclease/phosphatase family protein [Lacticigenium naphthae]